VQLWSEQGLSNATLKNRLSHLQCLAEKTNNRSLVKTNEEYGTARRQYVGYNLSVAFTDEKSQRGQSQRGQVSFTIFKRLFIANRSAALSENEAVFSLALFSLLKEIPASRATSELKPYLRGTFKKVIKQIKSNETAFQALQHKLVQHTDKVIDSTGTHSIH